MYTIGLVHMLDSKHRCKDTKVKVNPFALSVLILDYWTLMLAYNLQNIMLIIKIVHTFLPSSSG